MANASTGWLCTHKAWVTTYDDVSDTIRVQCIWQNNGWNYNINHVSGWVTCNGVEKKVFDSGSVNLQGDNYASLVLGYYDFKIDKTLSAKNISCSAKITSNSSYTSGTKVSEVSSVFTGPKTSYTISYNANGGSGAPGNQTKWYGTNLTLSTTKPTRTGYTFNGWATSSTGNVVYQPGANYTANSGATLYAKWTANTYTISYNANGGSGAPGNQTKTYGVNLTLSTTKPTRTNYNFLGWSTSSNGGVVYSSGATYTNNSGATLYAVWELAYLKPRILNIGAQRCDSNGTSSDSGTYIKIEFKWATDRNVSAIKIDWKKQTDGSWSTPVSVSATGVSGSVSQVVGGGNIDINTTWNIRASVSDSGGTTISPIQTISSRRFPIDVFRGGKGIAFNKAAETEGLFEVAFKTKLPGGLEGDLLWKENGYGDKFAISPKFNGSGDLNLLKIQGAVGDANTDPELYDLMTLSALSGNAWFKGTVDASNLLIDRGYIADLDSIRTATGIYRYTNNTVNVPSDFAAWGSVINIWTSASWGYQIAIGNYLVDNQPQILAIRTYTNDAWLAWQYIGGRSKVIYNNASGTDGSFTLTDSYSNYSRLDIIHEGGTTVWYTSSPKPYVQIYCYGVDGLTLIHQVKTLRFSNGTTVTADTARRSYSYTGTVTNDDKNYIKVYKVIGYK